MLTASSDFPPPGPGGQAARAAIGAALSIDPHTAAFIAESEEPRWSRFLKVWQALAAEKGRIPTRSEVDPAQLGADLLPNVFLVDLVRAPNPARPRFRFRLLGEVIQDREPTRPGDFLDALGAASDIAEIERHYHAALRGEIWIRNADLTWHIQNAEVFTYQVMVLPLADANGEITHLIGLALYTF